MNIVKEATWPWTVLAVITLIQGMLGLVLEKYGASLDNFLFSIMVCFYILKVKEVNYLLDKE